jgi:hypothetical protein
MSHDETVRPNLNGYQKAEAPTKPDPQVVPKAERRKFTPEGMAAPFQEIIQRVSSSGM